MSAVVGRIQIFDQLRGLGGRSGVVGQGDHRFRPGRLAEPQELRQREPLVRAFRRCADRFLPIEEMRAAAAGEALYGHSGTPGESGHLRHRCILHRVPHAVPFVIRVVVAAGGGISGILISELVVAEHPAVYRDCRSRAYRDSGFRSGGQRQ